jgi:hypothetical protein
VQELLAEDDVESLDDFLRLGIVELTSVRSRFQEEFQRGGRKIGQTLRRVLLIPGLRLCKKPLYGISVHKRHCELEHDQYDEKDSQMPELKMVSPQAVE